MITVECSSRVTCSAQLCHINSRKLSVQESHFIRLTFPGNSLFNLWVMSTQSFWLPMLCSLLHRKIGVKNVGVCINITVPVYKLFGLRSWTQRSSLIGRNSRSPSTISILSISVQAMSLKPCFIFHSSYWNDGNRETFFPDKCIYLCFWL